MSAAKAVVIFGKDSWPYTSKAREAFAANGYAVEYRNAKKNKDDLAEMLKHSKGVREVPVIVEDGTVTIGYGGTW